MSGTALLRSGGLVSLAVFLRRTAAKKALPKASRTPQEFGLLVAIEVAERMAFSSVLVVGMCCEIRIQLRLPFDRIGSEVGFRNVHKFNTACTTPRSRVSKLHVSATSQASMRGQKALSLRSL